jgi:hypothetical protein
MILVYEAFMNSFGSSMDKDKDTPIREFKPEAMCKTYVATVDMIHAAVLSISIHIKY